MGGVMYARNLLKALNTLDDKDKPFIDVYCRNKEAFNELKSHTNYPYINPIIINDRNVLRRLIRKFITLLFGEYVGDRVGMFRIRSYDDMIYPYGYGYKTKKLVSWKPDFQEKYLPNLFPQKVLRERERGIRSLASRGIPIVFSSYDSEKDYRKFYPEYNNKTFVVHFAVDHENLFEMNICNLKSEYKIEGEYILCANQFWRHKNHSFLFKAYYNAYKRGFNKKLVCTGNMMEDKDPDYIKSLKMFIKDKDLDDQIYLLGLIDDKKLYCLMRNAYAVVQPSLFEGWNTTVEDCKAFNKFIFLSNLSVHKEQIDTNVCFFDPHLESDLADKLLSIKPIVEPYNYSYNLSRFGRDFLEVINYMKTK